MSWVAQRSDLGRFGIAAAACSLEERQVTVVDAPSATFALAGHFFSGGEQVEFAAAGTGAVLPTGLSASFDYLIKLKTPPSMRLFQITNPDGSPVTLSDTGTGALVLIQDMGQTVDAILAAETSYLVANAKAYAGPWTTPPGWAPMIVGDLAAARVAKVLRVASPLYSMGELMTFRQQALLFCAQLNRGEPMTDGVGPVDATPTVADDGAALVRKPPGAFDFHERHGHRCHGEDVA